MTTGELLSPIEILLVEDNPGDVDLAREWLESSKVRNTLRVVRDGVEAMSYLRREGAYSQAERPDLIILDLNLPRKDGREVLAEVKADPSLRTIPVVVLTTSRADVDILRSYDLHANCYIAKPITLDGFMDVVRTIEGFWLSIVKLPPRGDRP